MARVERLSPAEKREWQAQFRLADQHYTSKIATSLRYRRAYTQSRDHWPWLDFDDMRNVVDNSRWPYDAVTTNLLFANFRAIEPRVILRAPRVRVRPRPRVTRRFTENNPNRDPAIRLIVSAIIQQVMNWRASEFEFADEGARAHFDDYFRGFGLCRHGHLAEPNRVTRRGRAVHTHTHRNIRQGWPYFVHQPLEYYRQDVTMQDMKARQWAAYGTFWRVDDLRANPQFSIHENRKNFVTHIVGQDGPLTPADARKQKFEDVELGRTLVYEVWDARERKIIFWVPGWETDIGIRDWPFEGLDGLPDTYMYTLDSNDGLEPAPEPDLWWDLQLGLNKMISVLLQAVKRSVTVIGVNAKAVEENQRDHLTDAEVLDIIETKSNPRDVIAALNLESNLVGLIQGIQLFREMIREVSGQGRIAHGTRENVESGTEAAQIGLGNDVRAAHRVEAMRKFMQRAIRKDWQVMQDVFAGEGADESVIAQVVDFSQFPMLFQLSPEQIRDEFDFEVTVGSMSPRDAQAEQRNVLALMEAGLNNPAVQAEFSPRQFARMLTRAFDQDETELLATEDAAFQQRLVDATEKLLFENQSGAGRQAVRNLGLGAALDAVKIPASGRGNGSGGPLQ